MGTVEDEDEDEDKDGAEYDEARLSRRDRCNGGKGGTQLTRWNDGDDDVDSALRRY